VASLWLKGMASCTIVDIPGVPTRPPQPPATAAMASLWLKGMASPLGATDCFATYGRQLNWNRIPFQKCWLQVYAGVHIWIHTPKGKRKKETRLFSFPKLEDWEENQRKCSFWGM
jgi:hypothetical protein